MKAQRLAILILSLILFAGCSSDEFSYEGKLSVSFIDCPQDIVVRIFTTDNSKTPIYTIPIKTSEKLSITLNVGNYVIYGHSALDNTFDTMDFGFQIKSNLTTKLSYINYSGGWRAE